MKVDFLTVVYNVDFELLKLQARSISKFVDPELINQIVVVLNDNTPGFADQVYNIRSLYGQFANRVVFLDYTDIVNKTDLESNDEYYNRRDWVSAQVARLLAARIIKSEWYINLDCKNIFTSLVNKDVFFDNSKAKQIGLMTNKTNDNYQWWINSCEYFSFDGLSIISQHCYSPFVFFTQEVSNLINHTNGKSLAYSLIESYCPPKDKHLADIALYCAWLHYQGKYSTYYCNLSIIRSSMLDYQFRMPIHDIHLHRELPKILHNKEKQDLAKACLVNHTKLLSEAEWEQFLLSFKAKIKYN